MEASRPWWDRQLSSNGAAGIVAYLHGQPFSIGALTIKNAKIAEIDFLNDPERIAPLDPSGVLDD